jgi:signal transduction histidine kinase
MVRERATEDEVRVAIAAYPEVDVVEGDERRIKQVIFSLLSNPVKFTPTGGAVDVSARRVNDEVVISVSITAPRAPLPSCCPGAGARLNYDRGRRARRHRSKRAYQANHQTCAFRTSSRHSDDG